MRILKLIPILLGIAGCNALFAQGVSVDKTSLTMTALYQGTAVSQQLNITSGTASTSYSIFVNSPGATPWLKLNNNLIAVNGTTNATITVVADPTGLTPGKYNGSL